MHLQLLVPPLTEVNEVTAQMSSNQRGSVTSDHTLLDNYIGIL